MSWDRLDPYENEPPFDYDETGEEPKKEMTLERALKIAECINLDYSGMDEKEIKETDEAIDKIFEYARLYITDRTAERKPNEVDGMTVKSWKCGWCCASVSRFNKYCGNCGRRLLDKGESI